MAEHIYFTPWRGAGYDKDGLYGRKVLIVGESHYTDWEETETSGLIRHDLAPGCTIECVQEVVNGEGGARYWTPVRNRIGGPEHEAQHPSMFWQKVAFCNFVQDPVLGGPGDRPLPHQWAAAALALREMLELLRPDRVWFTGDKLWSHVPPRDEKLPNVSIEGDDRTIPLEVFDISDGKRVFVTQTAHPRSNKFGRWLTPFLQEFVVRDWKPSSK